MRRLTLSLPALIILGATLIGSVSAQESVFRYATDPFSAEESTAEATDEESPTQPRAATEETEAPSSSYESYSSWPSAGKHTVQTKAIFRAQQREQRVADRLRNGYSASRPEIYGNPHYALSYYAPQPLWGGYYSWNNAATWYRNPSNWYYPRRSNSRNFRWAPVPDTYASIFGR